MSDSPVSIQRELPCLSDRLSPPAGRLRLLTFCPSWRRLKFPESETGFAGAFALPHSAKIAAFLVSATTEAPHGCGHILAEQRPGVRKAPAAYLGPGSVVPSFFVFLNPKTEVRHDS